MLSFDKPAVDEHFNASTIRKIPKQNLSYDLIE